MSKLDEFLIEKFMENVLCDDEKLVVDYNFSWRLL